MSPMHRVAIVDDDDGVRQSLSSLVRSLGHEVSTYASAVDFLGAADAAPDCLLTDLQMPQMSGEALQLALIERGCLFPIIFMTAFPTEAVRVRVMQRGACAFLAKPVDGVTMAQCLAMALADGCRPD